MSCCPVPFLHRLLSAALCSACVVLAACGGGGGGAAAGAAPVAAAPVTPEVPVPTAPEAPPTGGEQPGTISSVSPGAGFFVDSINGSDSNPGSFNAPWKSLAKLDAVRLRRGESIFLRCGSVWRESLTLNADHLVDASVITGYGRECATSKPRITGADLFSGSWTRNGNVWRRAVPASTPKIEGLFVNGVPLRTAQWPNHVGSVGAYAITAAGAPASTSLIKLSAADAAELAGKDLAGARVQIRTEPWFIEQRQVAALNASSLTLQSASDYPIDAGDGFVLQDKLWMLDAPGEFFHDTANGVLYIYPPDAATQADLNAAQVEGSVRAAGLVVAGRANLTLSNLRVDMATADGLAVHGAVSSTLDGVDALNNLRAGVRVDLSPAPVAPTRGVTIKNGRYVGNGQTGIDAGNVGNADILSNVVSATGLQQPAFSHAGIVGGDGARINGNQVDQSAFRGIMFSGFGNSAVTNNVVTGYCLRLLDCAAIYTSNGSGRQGTDQASSVVGNRIEGATPNAQGTVGAHNLLAGIYLDDLSRGVNVSGNLLMNMPVGVYVHNSSNSTVQSNSTWMTTSAGLLAIMDNPRADVMTGNVFSGNQIVPASSVAGSFPALPQITSSQAIRYWHALQGTGSLTSGSNAFVSNQVVSFYNDTSVVVAVGHTADEDLLSATAWKALNPREGTPSSPAYYAIYKPTLGAELLAGGSFSGGLGGWSSWFSSAGFGGNLALVNTIVSCGTQCAAFSAGLAGDRLSSPNFNMVAGAQYMVTFTATFLGSTSISHPDIARPDTPYDSYIAAPGLKSKNITMSGQAGDVLRYEAFFTSSSSEAARMNLRLGDPRVTVAFGAISLRPVTGYAISNFADWGAVVAAPATGGKTVTCADLGWAAACSVVDINGTSVAMPLTLAAGETRMLLWADSSWRQ